MTKHIAHRLAFAFAVALALLNAGTAAAQTSAFTYQGRLTDGGNPAVGSYDLTFKLFDTAAVGSGAQKGATLSLTGVAVSGGVFTAQLDFGACAGCFDGGERFLEIAVRPSGGVSFTTLSPRQPITSTPYSVRSVSAAKADALSLSCVSCVTSAQIQSVQGSQVTGAVAGNQISGAIPLASVPAGSASYIQNATAQQASSNFNISGDGTAGGTLSGRVVNATSALEIGGVAALRLPHGGSGVAVGLNATGEGIGNTIVGQSAGTLEPEARNNTIIGTMAGFPNFIHGNDNTLLGANTKAGETVSNATAIGAGASVTQSNSLVLGNGVNVGIGVTAPEFTLHVINPGTKGLRVETGSRGGTVASFGGFGEFQIDAPGIQGGRFDVHENGSVVLGDCPGCFPDATDRLVVSGTARIINFGSGGSSSLCFNASHQISVCSSSIRYKTNIADWRGGLGLINHLRPVTFDWKESRAHDLGLVAEQVAEVEPLLVTRNERGAVEGVKYDRLGVVLINAVKEQQAEIESQEAQIKSQADALAALQARLASLERAVRQPRRHRRTKNVWEGR